MDKEIQPIPGIVYEHYKGGLYEMICIAKDTTSGEKMVIYKSSTEGTNYARPLKEWNQRVKIDIFDPVKGASEKFVQRFKAFSMGEILE